MNTPTNLLYTKSHEWVLFTDASQKEAAVGLTDFAQDALGSLVYVNLPGTGDQVTAGESLGDVESVKSVSDVISPVTGTVSEVNDDVAIAPEKINEDPYGAWLVKVTGISGTEELLSAEEYDAFCATEGH